MKIMIMSDVVPAASAKNEYTDGAIEKLLSDGFREKLHGAEFNICLLYTSDAADDLLCVDLGGRRIIKKKHQKKNKKTNIII